MEILVLVGAVVIFVIVMGALGLKTISQAEVMMIERLGRYHRTLSPGINIIWPIVDKPRSILWRVHTRDASGREQTVTESRSTIDMREQVFDFPSQHVITSDNVVIEVNGLLYYQVTDPKRAIYEVANLPNAIEKLAQTTLRNIIGEMALDQTLTSRDEINSKMRAVLDDATDKWGVKVNRVELQDISPPPRVQEAMELQMKAERERRARILCAEGESKSLRVVAEGLADQTINPAQYLIAIRYLSTLTELGQGKKGDKTIFLPYEATSVLSSLGSIREIFSAQS